MCKVDEDSLANNFADAAYQCEQHNFDLNSVGKVMLSALPRNAGFKVVLTGEGADEHFAGYSWLPPDFLREPDTACPDSLLSLDSKRRHDMQIAVEEAFERQAAALGLSTDHSEGWENSGPYHQANQLSMPVNLLRSQPTLPTFAPWVQRRFDGTDCRQTVLKSISPTAREKIQSIWHPLHSSMYMFSKSCLSNVILTCLGDRTEMAHSIEARLPFLDHVLNEYINQLPPSVKLRFTDDITPPNDQKRNPASAKLIEKWILCEAAKDFISPEVYERKKQPYLCPIQWPRDGPLHQMLRHLCSREAVENLGFMSWEVVEQALQSGFGVGAD